MSTPVIDPESSVLSYPQWLAWEHQFSATYNPYDWRIDSGAFPSGMTFQPSWTVTASDTGDLINLTGHGFANGTCLVFRSLAGGGAGLSINTRYFAINAEADPDSFQLATTPGGSALPITSDYGDSVVYRPGFLTGAATIPGISTVRLIATNSGPTDSASVLYTIGIEPAAVAPDSNVDLVWDFSTNNIIAQTSSALNLTPAPRETPIIFVKEQDDLIVRLRLVKNSSVIAPTLGEDGNFKLVLKELETETQVAVSTEKSQQGTGDGTSYLVYAKFNGDQLASSLTNYENDTGTFYNALAEFEITFQNTEPVGPATIVRASKTFAIQIERDLGE